MSDSPRPGPLEHIRTSGARWRVRAQDRWRSLPGAPWQRWTAIGAVLALSAAVVLAVGLDGPASSKVSTSASATTRPQRAPTTRSTTSAAPSSPPTTRRTPTTLPRSTTTAAPTTVLSTTVPPTTGLSTTVPPATVPSSTAPASQPQIADVAAPTPANIAPPTPGPAPPPPAGPPPTDANGRPVGIDPARIIIPAIGVDASTIDLNLSGPKPEVPRNFADAGWYTQTRRPGEVGPAVIAGHINSKRVAGVFLYINRLRRGDRIIVSDAGGARREFAVTGSGQHLKTALPREVFAFDQAVPELRLITCGGVFDRTSGHYVDNYVVYARATAA